MALVIRKHNTHEQTIHLPLGSDFVTDLNRSGRNGEIASIQADGDELEHVISRLPNLPHSHRICIWRGELARFIAENLQS